jgi:hypothetical protein
MRSEEKSTDKLGFIFFFFFFFNSQGFSKGFILVVDGSGLTGDQYSNITERTFLLLAFLPGRQAPNGAN